VSFLSVFFFALCLAFALRRWRKAHLVDTRQINTPSSSKSKAEMLLRAQAKALVDIMASPVESKPTRILKAAPVASKLASGVAGATHAHQYVPACDAEDGRPQTPICLRPTATSPKSLARELAERSVKREIAAHPRHPLRPAPVAPVRQHPFALKCVGPLAARQHPMLPASDYRHPFSVSLAGMAEVRAPTAPRLPALQILTSQ